MKEAAIHSKQSGERGLAARSVKKVTRVGFIGSIQPTYFSLTLLQDTLAKFKG